MLEGGFHLLIAYRPPDPLLLLGGGALAGEPLTPLQRFLQARVRGRLLRIEQLALDRVIVLAFEGERGFLETPPLRLVAELTGRHANLLVLNAEDRILILDREVPQARNRFRQLLPGLPYQPPPPYRKLDPREVGLEDLGTLLGKPLAEAAQAHLDGLGKTLTLELARRAQLPPEHIVQEEDLPSLLLALRDLVRNPGNPAELRRRWQAGELQRRREARRRELEQQLRVVEARRGEALKAQERLEEARSLREEAELLLAYAHQIPRASFVELIGFDGLPRRISLDPARSVPEQAEALFARAKRLEASALRAQAQLQELEAQAQALRGQIEALEQASWAELDEPPRPSKAPKIPGLQFRSPGGHAIWVGRNARENDQLTRMARSDDLWFHVQGLPGSHVILRREGRNPDLPDLLHAARLAAYYSQARGERNVPVDYALKKNLRHPHKAAPGEVFYTAAKTLFVDALPPEEV
jgi:predicted ribosome quality control (RQC) complex YloA/Tae2 family protein